MYWLLIAETYLASKIFIDYISKGREIVNKTYKFESRFYIILALAGIVLLAIAVVGSFLGFVTQDAPLVSVADLNSITVNYQIGFTYIILVCVGIFFLCEAVEYYRKQTSLLKNLLHGYFTPLLAITSGSVLTAALMEIQNVPASVWAYTNWPFPHWTLFGLPILIFFIWPLHYIAFLSFFRAITNRASNVIWQGDTLP